MKGFVVYPDYRIDENRASVLLYGRLENGESFLSVHLYKPYFYIRQKDLEPARQLDKKYTYEKTHLKNKEGEAVVKIILDIPADVPKLRKKFEDAEIICYEADIRFPYRFLMDKEILGSIDIDGEYVSGGRVDRVYLHPDIKPIYWEPQLKVLSLDIETMSDMQTVVCLSLWGKNYKKTFLLTDEPIENTIACKTEEELLEKFAQEVVSYDPDILTGWNVIDFDYKELRDRMKKYNIPFVLGRDESTSTLKLEDNFFRESKANFSGRVVLDGISVLGTSFIKLPDYKLDTAAKVILKDEKLLKFTGKKFEELERIYKEDKPTLAAYNLKDAELAYRILEESKALALTIKRSLITGMPLDRVDASIASFDSLYIREAHTKGFVVPTGKFGEKEERIKGGYVRESEPGIYDYILVFDFKSLYPSMMRTFNIDPLSYVESGKGKNLVEAPNGARFKNEDGVLPTLLERLWAEREQARKNKDELTRYAIKILMNSFFGVLASPACRFFSLDVANAITHFGQYLIKLTGERIEKMGYHVIYQDTDSNFVVSKAKNFEDAEKIGKKIEKEINAFYADFIKKEYKRESFLELNFEKTFIKFLMPRLRKEEAGAKKRYAGLWKKDGKETIQFTGLEAVRGDWTELAKKFQKELYDRVFHDKEITEYIKKFIQELKKGKYDELLVYRKSIRKELKEYTATTPPHVKAARLLPKLEGNVIEYIITEKGPEPIQHQKHKIDYEHYIGKQIKPIANSVLVFFNKSFDELLKGSKQVSLSDY
ncbi:DNA polymerase II [Candidatus Woesearchaeota archaeon]|nr:DNA polymerase II [Candidatus Woesearchaeota archaeon]